MQLAKLKAY